MPLDTLSPLAEALQALPATGRPGFEGLVAKLLSYLTNEAFRPARSGPQEGRDIDSDPSLPWFTVVECKKYRADTPLNRRELVSEIHIATCEDPRIDLWCLATSRDVDSNITRWLQEEALERGIDSLILACGSAADPENLDVLCAHGAELVIQHCAAASPNRPTDLEAYLAAVGALADFSTRLEKLRGSLNGGTVGLPSFRDRLNAKLVKAMRGDIESRGRFGRRLDVAGAGDIPNIPRQAVRDQLDNFLNSCPSQGTSSPMCVVHGEEGNGKSWAVASWVYERLNRPEAPAVFWFSPGQCIESNPTEQLAVHAIENLANGREINFFAKLQRWIKDASRQQLLVVLDGINERHPVAFWANHLFRSLSEFDGHVSIIVTCRTQTWKAELAERLPQLRPSLIEVATFDDDEFAKALIGLDNEDVERMWRVGPLVRKPRYLATAVQVVRELQSGELLTVERLFYEVLKRQVSTRTDYPLGGRDFEDLLRHLAQHANNRLRAQDILAGLPAPDPTGEDLRELASGGVLRRISSGYILEERYLTVGMSLLLVDILRTNSGSIEEHRGRLAQWLNDTHQFPLTAKICAAASVRALLDSDLPRQAAAAMVLEFVHCTNPEAGPLEGILIQTARRVDVLGDVCEQLWSERGIDHAVERAILKGLVCASGDPERQGALKHRLTRWAGLIHSSGERNVEGSEVNSTSHSARVIGIAPLVNRAVDIGGGVILTRVENQRLVRLGRLALAVASFSDRRLFYPVLLTSLAAAAVMTTSRSNVVSWILASSRQPLTDLVHASLGTLTGLSRIEANRVERALLRATAAPEFAMQVSELNAKLLSPPAVDRFAHICRTPTRQELPAYFADSEVPKHLLLEQARIAATDPTFSYPPGYIEEVREVARSFDARTRAGGLCKAGPDYNWESLEPILCRVDHELLLAKLLEFVNDISERNGERLHAWVFAAASLTHLLSSREVESLHRVWQGSNTRSTNLTEKERFAEEMLLSMLLPHASAADQVDLLNSRRAGAQLSNRASSRFTPFSSIEEQTAVVSRLDASRKTLTNILWIASEQAELDDELWLAPVQRGLESESTIDRGLAMRLASKLSAKTQKRLVENVTVCSSKACALEKFYGTQLLLEHAEGSVENVLARCDLGLCCHLIGRPQTRNRDEIMRAFADLTLAWLQQRARNAFEFQSASPIAVHDPETSDYPWVVVSVDWSRQEDSVTFRSEMSVWGGLPSGSDDAFARAFDSNDRISKELQVNLLSTLDEGQECGDWGFASFWSPDTLMGMVDSKVDFLKKVGESIKEAMARHALHAVLPFANALCRALLPNRTADALELMSMVQNERCLASDIDANSAERLLDRAIFSAPETNEMQVRWLQRLDTVKNDADLLLCAEQLIAGGNEGWLRSLALSELNADNPYHRRRGLILLAASSVENCTFEAEIKRLDAETSGLDEVVKLGRRYRDTALQMAHWFGEGMRAGTVLEAYCSARLLLQCADRRVWRFLERERSEAAETGVSPLFLRILSLDDLKNAVRRTDSEGRKTYLGFQVCEHDAAPWIELKE